MLIGSYSPTLVIISLCVAILASYTALDLTGRIATAKGRAVHWWTAAGATAHIEDAVAWLQLKIISQHGAEALPAAAEQPGPEVVNTSPADEPVGAVVIGMAGGAGHWHSLPEFPVGVCRPASLASPENDQAVCIAFAATDWDMINSTFSGLAAVIKVSRSVR